MTNTYTDYREMLEKERLDGAVIATWHATHYEIARTCLEHGLHVMLEKPMVLYDKHARHLVELAQEQKRELIVGYPWNFSVRGLRAREVIQSDELGEIRYTGSALMAHQAASGLYLNPGISGRRRP